MNKLLTIEILLKNEFGIASSTSRKMSPYSYPNFGAPTSQGYSFDELGTWITWSNTPYTSPCNIVYQIINSNSLVLIPFAMQGFDSLTQRINIRR